MQKPPNQTLKEYIMDYTAKELSTPLSTVETVVNWCYKELLKEIKVHPELEVSGIGSFQLSRAKVNRRLEELKKILSHLTPGTEKYIEVEGELNELLKR